MTRPLRNPDVRRKADALLARMSLKQKLGQMTLAERMSVTPDDVREFHLGGVFSGSGSCPGDNQPRDWVAMNDAFWSASMDGDDRRLKIPLIYGLDAAHGNNNVAGATLFPHNIGLGAANDPALVTRINGITAREVVACGVDWVFAPCVAVAQDFHWGRTYESYSDDPDLVSAFAEASIRGMQDNPGQENVIACVKHWVGDGGTTNGINQGDTNLDLAELKRMHMTPFGAAIRAGATTIMASFNSWNGDKCHGHRFLLTDILKTRMRFDGLVVSDFDGIDYLSEDYHDAVALAINAGIDMFMVSSAWKDFITHAEQHVRRGGIQAGRIDDAVRRILMVKLANGLFDKPRPRERNGSDAAYFGSRQHREVAREAVRKSLVLLKNDNGLLPLGKSSRVFVTGRNADNRGHQCGGFSITWQGVCGNAAIPGGTSIWEGIKAVAPNSVLDPDPDSADAQQHDVAVIVVGERPYAEGMGDIRNGNHVIVEAGSRIAGSMNILEPYGHSLALENLHPQDLDAISTIRAKGIPAVVVLVSGRPLVIGSELQAASAFLAAWLPGSEGQGVADVLFGDFDFHGRLPFAWPEADHHLGAGCPDQAKPLFPRGYGLSYQ